MGIISNIANDINRIANSLEAIALVVNKEYEPTRDKIDLTDRVKIYDNNLGKLKDKENEVDDEEETKEAISNLINKDISEEEL